MRAEKARAIIRRTQISIVESLSISAELKEIERLADIGRATESAFDKGGYITGMDFNIYHQDVLLEWAAQEAKEETL